MPYLLSETIILLFLSSHSTYIKWKKNVKPLFTCEYTNKHIELKQKNYLSLGLQGRPSYKRSLQLSIKNIQHFKTWNFLNFTVVGNFALLDPDPEGNKDPDPLTQLNPDPIGIWIRIRNPDIKSLFLLFHPKYSHSNNHNKQSTN